jgi:uncharacterized protein (DUF488 family)
VNTEYSATVHTIGFTKKIASEFFELLRSSGTQRVIDVRLNNASQLAGFWTCDDLRYFLKEICYIDYVHLPVLAPSSDILAAFGKHKKHWPTYELAFLDLMKKREIEKQIDPAVIKGGCPLCSEATPHFCPRRLVVDYLQQHWGILSVQHLYRARRPRGHDGRNLIEKTPNDSDPETEVATSCARRFIWLLAGFAGRLT